MKNLMRLVCIFLLSYSVFAHSIGDESSISSSSSSSAIIKGNPSSSFDFTDEQWSDLMSKGYTFVPAALFNRVLGELKTAAVTKTKDGKELFDKKVEAKSRMALMQSEWVRRG